jgi:hypothetical protein
MLRILFLLVSCSQVGNESLNREQFENQWWELSIIPVCFNVHETGELLIHDEMIYSEGPWKFKEPNSYEIQDDTFDVERDGDCWKIYMHSQRLNDIACKCTLKN